MTDPHRRVITYINEAENEAVESVRALLDRPSAPMQDYSGSEVDGVEYFDPWDIFPVYGNYSSEFDDMALQVLDNLLNDGRKNETLAHEIFREILCNMNLCSYGTSPRICFPTPGFKKLLPEYISKWKEYYRLQWEGSK